jgi:hypothetical protein
MIVELRQYLLKPGRRDELIELFDREFIASQEELGMRVLGRFRDLDRPDMFVWLRGFADLDARREGLTAFYSGPVWKQHGRAANATMIDSDNVLLLRTPSIAPVTGPVDAHIHYADRPWNPVPRVAGALATLSTEYAENDYPALPVREDEHALVVLANPGSVVPGLPQAVRTERLRLEPTT